MGFEPRERARLVRIHHPRILNDIGRKDGGQAALGAFFGQVICLLSGQPTSEIVWTPEG